jgi:hypothetical protein
MKNHTCLSCNITWSNLIDLTCSVLFLASLYRSHNITQWAKMLRIQPLEDDNHNPRQSFHGLSNLICQLFFEMQLLCSSSDLITHVIDFNFILFTMPEVREEWTKLFGSIGIFPLIEPMHLISNVSLWAGYTLSKTWSWSTPKFYK